MEHSDVFKDMDEVRKFYSNISKKLPPEEHDLFQTLLGLKENQGLSESVVIDGKSVEIDAHLAPFIEKWRALGVQTLACCSGLRTEHKNEPKGKAYISLAFDSDDLAWLQNYFRASSLPLGVEVQKTECYLKPAISVKADGSDQELIQFWDAVDNAFATLFADRGTPKICRTCFWYASFEGVCCNGECEHRADFMDPDRTCKLWKEKDSENV